MIKNIKAPEKTIRHLSSRFFSAAQSSGRNGWLF